MYADILDELGTQDEQHGRDLSVPRLSSKTLIAAKTS